MIALPFGLRLYTLPALAAGADLLARLSRDAAAARFVWLQLVTVAMERTKRQRLGTAGQDMAATVQGVCGHG